MNFFKSKQAIRLPEYNCVLPHALKVPSLKKLVGKRVVLASNSPRRKEILQTFVRSLPLNSTQCSVMTLPLRAVIHMIKGTGTRDCAVDV